VAEHPEPLFLAIGKAAASMARGAIDALGDQARGIAVCPQPETIPGFNVIVGEHPIPGALSLAAGEHLMEAAANARGLVVVLLSGGASSLAEAPLPGISPTQIREQARTLLSAGMAISDMNVQRTALSAIKGGGLTRAARPARVITLALSDVGSASPSVIGSGPSLGSDIFRVIGDITTALQGASRACRALGLEVVVTAPMTGAAREYGQHLASESTHLLSHQVVVAGGETTVRVAGSGRGGRNQEVALAAAVEIEGTGAVIGSIGSDGIDGPTPHAGAIVDGDTVSRGMNAGLDAVASLDDNNSANYLEATADVVDTGPTGTNVGDIAVATSR
jgi:glycerate 2-kinase